MAFKFLKLTTSAHLIFILINLVSKTKRPLFYMSDMNHIYLNSLSASNNSNNACAISFFFRATLPFSCKVMAKVRA